MSVDLHTSKDVVAFCKLRCNPEEVNKIIQEGKETGLSKSGELVAFTQNGEYVPVLKAVWSERDRPRRLEWLRQNASLHAPLMYELALAEFVHSSTVETMHSVSIPLISAASLRVRQDYTCSKADGLLAVTTMNAVYNESLVKLFTTKLQDPRFFEAFLRALPKIDMKACLEKEKLTMCLSLSTQLPNPEWTRWRDSGTLFEDALHPSSEWQQRRIAFAEREISRIEQELQRPLFSVEQACSYFKDLLKKPT